MFSFFRRHRLARKERRALIERDARDLIARFGDAAYFEARLRNSDERFGGAIDANRPPGHWSAVMSEIAKLTNRQGPKDWGGYSDE